MHIALLSAEYFPQPGGVGDYTRRLGLALAAQGQRVAVIGGTAARPPAATPPDPLTLLPVVEAWDWRCWPAVIQALDRLRPAVLHIQYQTGAYSMHPAINLLPWRLRSLPRRPRLLVTFHDLLEPYLLPKAGLLRRWVTRRLAADADAVVATNPADAATLAARQPHLLLDTIPIGSNIPLAPPASYQRAAWRAQLGVAPGERLVAYFGLLSRSKGVDLLLDALEQLPPTPRMRLLLVGGQATTPHDRAYAATLAPRLAAAQQQGQLIQTGHVEAAHVSAHLLASDIVALPFRDGASLRSGSLLAALTHGAALVTTRTAADAPAATGLVDGEHALLVPPGDSAALAAALHRLAADDALRQRLGQAAATLGASFDWNQIAHRHAQRYGRLMETTSG
jgi:glycosyltransferase involved in cell wall biosynthesis